MALETIDLTTVSTSDLLALSRRIEQEYSRRRVLEEAPKQADEIATKYLEATGRLAVETGGTAPTTVPAYIQPTGAHDAYPKGAYITFEGKVYKSLIPANVWTPTAYARGWEQVSPADVPTPPVTPAASAWEAGKAYKVGDLVAYKGKTYRIVQAHTSAAHWTPDAVASLYTVVG